MLLSRSVARMLPVGLMVLGAGTVCGQDYPSKPIHILTTGVGGGSDFIARAIAQGIAGPLGQPVVVDNRTSVLAAETVAKAPPDGYNLTVQGASLWLGPILQKYPYDAVNDLAPITLISREVFIVAVHPSLPVKSIKELIALAKARPGALNYGSGPAGGTNHLVAELFKSMAGVSIVGVPYKGTAAAITAQLGGEVQVTILDVGVLTPHLKSGRLRALAVTSLDPTALAPGLPTVAASGLPGYEALSMTGIWATAKTPAAIINQLNKEIVRFLNAASVKEKFLSAGSEVVATSPEQFLAIIKADIAKWTKVIRDAGIKIS